MRRKQLDQIDAAINRLQARLFRTSNALQKKIAARRRLDKPRAAKLIPADLSIPEFLKRSPNAADEKAKAEILTQQDARKKAKAKARAEKAKAKRRGDLKKMPLEGRAAIAAILAAPTSS